MEDAFQRGSARIVAGITVTECLIELGQHAALLHEHAEIARLRVMHPHVLVEKLSSFSRNQARQRQRRAFLHALLSAPATASSPGRPARRARSGIARTNSPIPR